MKKRRITAAELMEQLNRDPEFVAAREARDEEIERHRQAMRKEEDPLIQDLQAAGYQVESVWDLVNTSVPYPSALPILLQHLQRPYRPEIRDGIARAMAVPDARFAWDMFIKLYKAGQEKGFNDGLACAIAETADENVVHEVIPLLVDRNNRGRILMLRALERAPTPEALKALQELTNDSDLGEEASATLRRLERKKKRRSPKP